MAPDTSSEAPNRRAPIPASSSVYPISIRARCIETVFVEICGDGDARPDEAVLREVCIAPLRDAAAAGEPPDARLERTVHGEALSEWSGLGRRLTPRCSSEGGGAGCWREPSPPATRKIESDGGVFSDETRPRRPRRTVAATPRFVPVTPPAECGGGGGGGSCVDKSGHAPSSTAMEKLGGLALCMDAGSTPCTPASGTTSGGASLLRPWTTSSCGTAGVIRAISPIEATK
mmetsp:Transcript_10014/g.30776  ORF Transcript_10014/g.30776 Transcript_10014/m.30776 type:complete len:231 (-) Transcript_10014:3235-3927(-)|eukprot:scaffold73313_cov27-Tisochrysis_lutea.AAC.2